MARTLEDRRAQQRLAEKVLGDPDLFPDAFKAWIPRWLYGNINFELADAQLPTVQKFSSVGTTGAAVFQNSWVNFGGTNAVAAYYRDPFGIVHLKGVVKNGTAIATTIFQLPPGHRPQEQELFGTVSNNAFGAVLVNPDGTVQGAVGSTLWISLCGISFRAYA